MSAQRDTPQVWPWDCTSCRPGGNGLADGWRRGDILSLSRALWQPGAPATRVPCSQGEPV